MERMFRVCALAGAVAGCASPHAGAQGSPASDDLARVHVYEVPRDRLAPQGAPESGFVEVSGSASVSVPVDLARVSFSVETRAVSAAGASQANAATMSAVLDALRAAEFEGLSLETFGYVLRPEYRTTDTRTRVVDGYTALNNVRSTVTDVGSAGRVIDVAIGAGANRVSGIMFEASDTEAARRDALAEAVRVARAQAEVIARSLGHPLGPPLEARGGAQRPIPRPLSMDMTMARVEAVPTPVETGDQTVTADVTLRFRLGPETEPR